MTRKCRLLVLFILAIFFLSLTAWAKSNKIDEGKTEDEAQTCLSGDSLDAVDLLILVNSINSARGWGKTLEISPVLEKRLLKYEEKVKVRLKIEGANDPLIENGVITRIPPDAKFKGVLTGALNAEVELATGEVGVIKGEIFIGEGTQLTIDGKFYKYVQGKWWQISEPVGMEESILENDRNVNKEITDVSDLPLIGINGKLEGIHIKSASQIENRVELNAVAYSNTDIANLMLELENSQYLKNIMLISHERISENSINFELSFLLKDASIKFNWVNNQ